MALNVRNDGTSKAQQLIELIQCGDLVLDGKQIVDLETIKLLD